MFRFEQQCKDKLQHIFDAVHLQLQEQFKLNNEK